MSNKKKNSSSKSQTITSRSAAEGEVQPKLARKFSPLALGTAAPAVATVFAIVSSSGGSNNESSADGGKGSHHEIGSITVDGQSLRSRSSSTTTDRAIGSAVPTLAGVSVLDGSKLEIKPNGKPMVIAFLAHWCPHCQAELPRLVELAKTGVLNGIDVYAVATATSSGYPNYPPSAWLKREQWPFPALADSDDSKAANAFGLDSYPYVVFVDALGKLAGRISGEVTAQKLATIFTALAAGRPLPALVNGSASSS